MHSGFVASLNEPHAADDASRYCAACRGVLTSLFLGMTAWGSACGGHFAPAGGMHALAQSLCLQMRSGFVALLNEPHATDDVSRYFAA